MGPFPVPAQPAYLLAATRLQMARAGRRWGGSEEQGEPPASAGGQELVATPGTATARTPLPGRTAPAWTELLSHGRFFRCMRIKSCPFPTNTHLLLFIRGTENGKSGKTEESEAAPKPLHGHLHSRGKNRCCQEPRPIASSPAELPMR